jgi:hypothetical protein
MHRITQLAADNKYQLSKKDKRVLQSRFAMMEEHMTERSCSDDEGEDDDDDRDSPDVEHSFSDGGSDRKISSTSASGNRLLHRGNSRRDANTLNFYDIVDALKEKRQLGSSAMSG